MKKTTVQRFFEVIHVVALSAWFGAVGMSGIVAATVFPIMAKIQPTLGTYSMYDGDHALLAGGMIAGRVFLIADSVQLVSAATAFGSFLIMQFAGYSIDSFGRVIRFFALLGAMGILGYHLFVLMPGMAEDLRLYWDLAAQGKTEQADLHKDAFLALHQASSNSLKSLMIATLVCLVLAVWTSVGSDRTTTQESSA